MKFFEKLKMRCPVISFFKKFGMRKFKVRKKVNP
ncbi:hypothetical protein Y592_06300 [Thermosipho sp. 1070]|nr:hypothetical protein Y592_06300 [Thermosipho sp. 1070]